MFALYSSNNDGKLALIGTYKDEKEVKKEMNDQTNQYTEVKAVTDVTKDGFFTIRGVNSVEVYERKTIVEPGWIYNGETSKITLVKRYHYSQLVDTIEPVTDAEFSRPLTQ